MSLISTIRPSPWANSVPEIEKEVEKLGLELGALVYTFHHTAFVERELKGVTLCLVTRT